MVTRSNCHTEDPQILGNTIRNLIATAAWCPGFVNPCYKQQNKYKFLCSFPMMWYVTAQTVVQQSHTWCMPHLHRYNCLNHTKTVSVCNRYCSKNGLCMQQVLFKKRAQLHRQEHKASWSTSLYWSMQYADSFTFTARISFHSLMFGHRKNEI
jgi:hypothetical protein